MRQHFGDQAIEAVEVRLLAALRVVPLDALYQHSANAALNLQVEASNKAAPELALEVVVLDFAVVDEIEKAFEAATEQKVDAILPLSDPMALSNAARIGALSLRYKIPLVSPFREITDAGGLLNYGPDLSMLFRSSASLVDQILKGAKPGDLPIGEPSDFELGANLQCDDTCFDIESRYVRSPIASAGGPVLAHRVSSPQRINSGAIGGIADMPRSLVAHPGDANDPSAT